MYYEESKWERWFAWHRVVVEDIAGDNKIRFEWIWRKREKGNENDFRRRYRYRYRPSLGFGGTPDG